MRGRPPFDRRSTRSCRLCRPALPSPCVFEAVALALRPEEVAAVREAIEGPAGVRG